MRTTTLLLCLSLCVPLAACASASAGNQLAAAPSPEPTGSVTPSAAARAAHASAKKNDKKDDSQGEPKEEWWKAGGITREKINAMCWMKYEKGRADLPIDKRADLVNACVAQALKEHPLN